MKYRPIAKTGLSISEISLGCWTLGGISWVDGRPNGWANVDEAEAISAIHQALDRGVNHFDNADVYGNGRAERLLGTALKSRSDPVVVATKLGHFRGCAEHAYDRLHLRHQAEQSLKNLGRETLDIYYFHHGDFGPQDRYLPEALEEMHRLRQEGKVRAIGLSAYSEADFQRLVPIIKPDILQSWANALDDHFIRAGSPVRTLLEQYGIPFVCFSPIAQGTLLGKYDPKNPPQFEAGDMRQGNNAFSAENLGRLAPRIDQLKARFGATTEDLVRVALQYLLHEPVVGCVIPGFRNPRQVQCNLAGADRPLSDEDIAFVRQALHG